LTYFKEFRAKTWIVRILENVLRTDHTSYTLQDNMTDPSKKDGSFAYNQAAMQREIDARGYGVDAAVRLDGSPGQVVPGGVDREVEDARPQVSKSRLQAGFDNAQDVSEHEVRHGARRRAAFEQLLSGMENRQAPAGKVEFIGLDKAHRLMEEYSQARNEGFEDRQLDIVPLSSYAAKLFPEGRKPLRALMANEWGVIQKGTYAGTILILSDSNIGSAPMVTVQRDPHATVKVPAPAPTGLIVNAQGQPHPGLLPGPKSGS